MFSKRNKNTNYINIILYVLVVLLLFGMFRFIFYCINLVSETNQNNIAHTIKIRNSLEEVDKIVDRAEVNLDVLSDNIKILYDIHKLHDKKYNAEFINKLDLMTNAALINSPGVNGVWFQLNIDLPFALDMYTWYGKQNGKCINLKHIIEQKEPKQRPITPITDPYYFNAIKNKGINWSDFYIDPDVNIRMVTISKPIYKDNQLIGVVGIDLSVSDLNNALKNMQRNLAGSNTFLLDKDGNILLFCLDNNSKKLVNKYNFNKIFNLNSQNETAIAEFIDNGVQKTAVLLPLSNNYHVVNTFPNNLIFKGFNQLFKTVYFIFFLLVALTFLTIYNIKHIKKINKEVNDRAKKLEIIFESSPNIIVLKNTNGKYLTCNSQFASIFNLQKNDIVNKTAYDIFTQEQANQITKIENLVKKTKKMISYEAKYDGVDGHIYHKKHIIPLLDSHNELVEILIIAFDITKNKVEENILRNAKENAEKTTIMKSNFLANMSHEIRTPLNGVVGFIQLLKDTNLSFEQAEFVEDAQKSSEILLGIINDILDFSKIEAGKLQIENISFDIRSLVEDITLFSNTQAENKGLEISSLICSDVPKRVFGDPGRVRQILNNLVSNAIKFTQKGEIVIYVKQILEDSDTSFVSFEVKDTGIGIEEDKLNLIFEEFAQSDPSMTRKYGGTGLGLAICQRLVNLMGGALHVKSRLGEGSAFTFNLPFKKDRTSSIEASNSIKTLDGAKILVIDDNLTDLKIIRYYLSEANCLIYEAKTCQEAIDVLNNENDNISLILVDYKMQLNCDNEFCCFNNENGIFNEIPVILYTSLAKRGDSIWAREKGFKGYLTKPIKKNDLIDSIAMALSDKNSGNNSNFITKHIINENKFSSKTKILVVEDSDLNCKLINKILETHGLYCEFAFNGYEAIEAYKSNKYDLILMDCQMPIVDGYEATKEIRKLEKVGSHIPIIAMTANALPKDRDKCLSIGMDDYISKPIDIKLLLDMIGNYINFSSKKSETISCESTDDKELNNILDKISNELMFDKQTAIELFIDYIHLLPSALNDLETAFNQNDMTLIKSVAHKLKGASANLRINEIAELCLQIENEALNNNFEKCSELLNSIAFLAQHLIAISNVKFNIPK